MKKLLVLVLFIVTGVTTFYIYSLKNDGCYILRSKLNDNRAHLKKQILNQIEYLAKSKRMRAVYDYSSISELSPEFSSYVTSEFKYLNNFNMMLITKPDSLLKPENVEFVRINLFRSFVQFRVQGESDWPRVLNEQQLLTINDHDFQLVCSN